MTVNPKVHQREVSDERKQRPVVEFVIGGAIVLAIVVIGILIQQITFYSFVQQNGGVPDGIFKKPDGASYKLWSLTVPLWATTAVTVSVGITWALRLRRLQTGWLLVAAWIIYVAIIWSLFGASSGLVEVLGKGEAFL